MIFRFPDLDMLRLVLTSGLVPTDVSLRPVAVHSASDGAYYVDTKFKHAQAATAELNRLGVKRVKVSPGPTRSFSTWLEILPLTLTPAPVLSAQAPVLFELPASEMPAIVTEMLRLGNDRQAYRWFSANEPEGDHDADDVHSSHVRTVLLRVINPPYYTLLRALDRDDAKSGTKIRAYLEQAPRFWVEIGRTHPLGHLVKLEENQSVLVRGDGEWICLDEVPFRDVYEVLQFAVPPTPVDWQPIDVPDKLDVPLKLVAGNAADASEFWVLRGSAIDELDAFAREVDERNAQRLTFAVANTPGGESVAVLRLKPSKLPPPEIRLPNAVGYKSYWKIPNLFVPVGTRLHPQVRRETVRALLADDTDHVVWLVPDTSSNHSPATGPFTTETLSEDAFRPLEDWVEYVVVTAQAPLTAWVESTTFEFDQFVCNEPTHDPKPKGPDRPAPDRSSPPRDRRPATDDSPSSGRGSRKGDGSVAPGASNLASSIPPPTPRAINDWKVKRDELQTRFLSIEGALERDERQALWPQLAIANTGARDLAEATICWVNAMWELPESPADHVAGWANSESNGAPLTAAEFDRVIATADAEPTPGVLRRFAAMLLALIHRNDAVPTWLVSRLPAAQKYIEANEGRLPVRAVWLLSTRLASLAGADVLGVARVRDRILQRLLDGGLNAELDLPYFLRTAGLKDSSRLRAVKDRMGELHGLIRDWTRNRGSKKDGAPDRSRWISSPLASTDNRITIPYIDLMFAFAYAKLGEATQARTLLENARAEYAQHANTVERKLAGGVLYRAFRYRVEQAIAGQPHAGQLDPAIVDEIEQMARQAKGLSNTPQGMAHFAITRMQQQSRILEPQDKLDPYAQKSFMRFPDDDIRKTLIDLKLPGIRDAGLLARTILDYYRHGNGKPSPQSRFHVLLEGLPLAPRVGEAFTVDLLRLVPETLRGVARDGAAIGDLTEKQGRILERGLWLAGHYDQRELAHNIVTEFLEALRAKPEADRFELVNLVAKECLRSLRKLGLRDEVDRLLGLLQEEVLQKNDLAQLRAKYVGKPERWWPVLHTQLSLATGWLAYDLKDKAEPILEEARKELVEGIAMKLGPDEFGKVKDKYFKLAQAYLTALGQRDAETGLPAICRFFQEIDPRFVVDTFTTNKYYSRLHLNLTEEVILAVVSDDFVLGPSARRWLEEDEMLVRRRIHRDMRNHLAKCGL